MLLKHFFALTQYVSETQTGIDSLVLMTGLGI